MILRFSLYGPGVSRPNFGAIASFTHAKGRAGVRAVPYVLALALGAPLCSGVAAQTYPTHPITLIIPFAAGGPSMTMMRIMEPALAAALGQPVIIENVAGAAGSLGTGKLARAAPDGYTIGLGQWDNLVLNGAIYALPYDLKNDFAPIALFASNAQLIVSRNSAPAKNLKELIAWLQSQPDKASQGTAGAGSAAHISGAYFQSVTKTR